MSCQKSIHIESSTYNLLLDQEEEKEEHSEQNGGADMAKEKEKERDTENQLDAFHSTSYAEEMFQEELYLEPISEHLRCSVCLELMRHPVQCPSGHSFCKRCMEMIISRKYEKKKEGEEEEDEVNGHLRLHRLSIHKTRPQNVCPICRVVVVRSNLVVNRALEGMIQELVLRCPTILDHKKKDESQYESKSGEKKINSRCHWTGHLHACRAHLEVCHYARVTCPHPHCRLTLPRHEASAHILTCAKSPLLYFHLYAQCRCGSIDAWSHLQQLSDPLAVGYRLLVFLLSGISTIPKDIPRAKSLVVDILPYLENKVKQNNAHACFILASLHQEGIGVPKIDAKKAFELFSIAADAGHPGAQCSLGICYDAGIGTSSNIQKALNFYQLAADQGFAPALFNVGVCYFNGDGVTSNVGVALDYYERAAEMGYAAALFNLGVCYSAGKGAARNEEVGVGYVRRAALQGYEKAVAYLEKYHLGLY